MKKLLLLGVSLLVVASASGQALRTQKGAAQTKVAPKMEIVKPNRNVQTLTATELSRKNVNSTSTKKAPRKETILDVWYTRPAGVYPSGAIFIDGEYVGEWPFCFYPFKPYKEYTFKGYVEGAEDGDNLITFWNVFIDEEEYYVGDVMDLVIDYPYWAQDEMPIFNAGVGTDIDDIDDRNAWFIYQSKYYDFDYKSDPPTQTEEGPNNILVQRTINDFSNIDGYDIFFRQRPFTAGGRFGTEPYTITRYTGLKPADPNDGESAGNWFGKNAGTQDGLTRVDGIAQAFEKPEQPYLLKSVCLEMYFVNLSAPVEFTCKVYRLDEVPEYREEGVARLAAEPGELIATGTVTASPEMVDKTSGYNIMVLNFPLMGHDADMPDLEYEVTPTVDYPILVVFDNYNDAGMEALTQFSTFISTTWEEDEGFGETAYIKIDDADEDGVFHGDYMWYGLNNLFGQTMKTAFLVGINIEHPFIMTYLTNDEEYTFPNEGGPMIRQFQLEDNNGNVEDYTMNGVEFVSSFMTAEGDWFLTWNDDENLPDWLHMNLYDDPTSDPGNQVYYFTGVNVTADPLPEGVTYREAKIRFEIPGDYVYYTFKQGDEPEPQPGNRFDINQDGEVNIADVNTLIQMILSGDLQAIGDCNQDGEVTLADINTLIDYILNN